MNVRKDLHADFFKLLKQSLLYVPCALTLNNSARRQQNALTSLI